MRVIVLLIIVFVVPYTYINLRYRKPGPSFRPYQDARERESIARAGYARVTITASRPDTRPLAPGSAISAEELVSVSAAEPGLPADLSKTLLEQPILPLSLGPVRAAPSASAEQPYIVDFECTLPDSQVQLAGARLYTRAAEVLLVPDFERLTGGLSARTRQNLVRATVPAGSLPPGRYRFTIPAKGGSKSWTVQVH